MKRLEHASKLLSTEFMMIGVIISPASYDARQNHLFSLVYCGRYVFTSVEKDYITGQVGLKWA